MKTFITGRGLLSVLVAAALFSPVIYPLVEAQLVDAAADNVIVTLNVDAGISITSPSDVSMSQNLGVSADTAVGSAVWNVKTNNAAGYTLAVKATTSPALASGANSVADYTPAVAATPETWSVSSGTAEFGFSAFGTHISTGTWGTDSDCIAAAHVPSAGLKYRDFDTSDITIGTSAATTTTAGIDSTVCFAAEQDGFYIPSGTYQATVVATATTL
ncbi:MAG: hypothetical protein KBD16_02050 [Candidatus Pacebacteria bacterium]|nr:hypothetical protein [Candidatus Paceibacterota bacterium]